MIKAPVILPLGELYIRWMSGYLRAIWWFFCPLVHL